MYQRNLSITKGKDWVLIWLYILIVMIGLLCIFSVEYKATMISSEAFSSLRKITASNSYILAFVS